MDSYGIIASIIIGAIAGWLAGLILKNNHHRRGGGIIVYCECIEKVSIAY